MIFVAEHDLLRVFNIETKCLRRSIECVDIFFIFRCFLLFIFSCCCCYFQQWQREGSESTVIMNYIFFYLYYYHPLNLSHIKALPLWVCTILCFSFIFSFFCVCTSFWSPNFGINSHIKYNKKKQFLIKIEKKIVFIFCLTFILKINLKFRSFVRLV